MAQRRALEPRGDLLRLLEGDQGSAGCGALRSQEEAETYQEEGELGDDNMTVLENFTGPSLRSLRGCQDSQKVARCESSNAPVVVTM